MKNKNIAVNQLLVLALAFSMPFFIVSVEAA